MRRWRIGIAGLALGLLLGCSAQASVVVAPRAPKPAPKPAPPPPPPPPEPVQIKGLTGTLNKDDVHQTMDARQAELDACIGTVRRREAFVHGSVRYAFAVDAQGHVADLRTLESDIGHFELERCIADVLTATQFPPPDGRATARFEWGMQVLGVYEDSEPLDPALLARVLGKRAADVYKGCELRRYKNRMQVTAYVGRRGRVLSAGVVPTSALEAEQLDCVLHAIKTWPMPKPKRRAKVSFVLR